MERIIKEISTSKFATNRYRQPRGWRSSTSQVIQELKNQWLTALLSGGVHRNLTPIGTYREYI